jgi:uncharacterized membrane protein YtjA (UPF0391 family)
MEIFLLTLAVIFFIVALVAGLLGLPAIAIVSVEIAKILFGIFLVLFIIALVFGLGFFGPTTPV